MHKTVLKKLQEIILRFKIQEATGLNLSDSLVLLQDLIDLQAINMIERGKFLQTKKRALFLSHCTRKYLDGRCKAAFRREYPILFMHSLFRRLLSQPVSRKKGYDVYIVPGGSCIPKILKKTHYEGVVGIACGEEMRVLKPLLNSLDVAGQAIPLLKNGCANTVFNMDTLGKSSVTPILMMDSMGALLPF